MLVKEEEKAYKTRAVDQDGLWKKVIEELFEDFLLFFTPALHEQVDFTKPIEFLDGELFQEVVDKKEGRRHADRLAKVQLKNGKEQWVLIHVEVQSSGDDAFSERMFQYFYRIYDRYQEKIVALAVHTFQGSIDKMKTFQYDYFDTKLSYTYANYRTEDYSNDLLERSENIFSKVVLAAKGLHKTKDEVEERYEFKRKLMNELIRNQRYSRTAVMATLHFIDYLLRLPEDYKKKLSEDIRLVFREENGLMELYDEDNAPPTVLESFGAKIARLEKLEAESRKEGLKQGLEQGLALEKTRTAKRLLARGMSVGEVMLATELSREEVVALQED